MRPLINTKTKTNITATTAPATANYKITANAREYLVIKNIDLGFDSNFLSVGNVKILINGDVVTSGDSAVDYIKYIANYSYDFGTESLIFIEPNASLEIFFYVDSSSGYVQPSVTGLRLTPDEFKRYMKTKLGVDVL